MRTSRGMALVAVLAGLMVLSAVGLGLALSVHTEARIQFANFEGLQAEQLARSGQEMVSLLEARGYTSTELAGTPVEVVTPGFRYRMQFDSGAVDIDLEADNGKVDLNGAPEDLVANFFTLWTGDPARGGMIAAAIQDWRDADSDPRPNGAEAAFYAGTGVAPRNTIVGVSDLAFIPGIRADDLSVKALKDENGMRLREGLDSYITPAGLSASVNPNFASVLVLRSIPDLSESAANVIIARRSERPFTDLNDFQARAGIRPDSAVWRYFTLDRRPAAVLTTAKLKGQNISRTERRVTYAFTAYDPGTGEYESKVALGRIQRDSYPGYLDSQ